MNLTSLATTAPFSDDDNNTPINTTLLLLNRQFNESLDVNQTSVKTQLKLYDVLIPALGTVIIILNLAVVISSGLILKKGQQPRATYLFLGNVAMTDLITGLAVVFGQVYPVSGRNHTICAIQLGMIVSSTLTSIYSVGLIAIDRYLYIIHGIQYQRWVYPNRARLAIILAWLIGCIVGFMPLFGWYGDTNNGKICWFILLTPKNLILFTVVMGIIPIFTVVTLYSIILYYALKKVVQLQNIGTTTTNNGNNLRIFRGGVANNSQIPDKSKPTKAKAIKVVLFTTCSFIICWCPYFIASLIFVYQCDSISSSKRCKNISIIIASPLAILGFSNSLINPIIYAWWHKGFRNYVQKRMSVVIQKTRWRNSINGDNFVGHHFKGRNESKTSTTGDIVTDPSTNT